jgi:hypothetical protein
MSSFTKKVPRSKYSSGCPKFGGYQPQEHYNGQYTECTYSTDHFEHPSDLDEYHRHWGYDNDCDQILEKFCQKQSVSCPVDPATGKQMTVCSNFIATDDAGTKCREWAAKNPSQADNAKKEYCSSHSNESECACISRNDDPIYQLGKSVSGDINDACWYKPCQNSTTTLVPSGLENPVCPNDTCSTIVSGIRSKGTSYTPCQLESKISCNFTGGNHDNNHGGFFFGGWGLGLILIIILFIFAFWWLWRCNKEKRDSY